MLIFASDENTIELATCRAWEFTYMKRSSAFQVFSADHLLGDEWLSSTLNSYGYRFRNFWLQSCGIKQTTV